MASITLGVNTPELCQNICQVRHIFIYSCWFWLKQANFLFGIGASEICKFSGRSYMCCHHLDPRVLSCLPSEVSDEKHIANIIGKSTKTKFRTFWVQIFWEQKLLLFVSQKLVSLSANLLSSFQKLWFCQWDFYPQLCHLFLNCQCHGVCWLCLWVNFCQTFQPHLLDNKSQSSIYPQYVQYCTETTSRLSICAFFTPIYQEPDVWG